MIPTTILLVDDRQENLFVLRQLLEEPGRILLAASSGPEALALLLEHEVAVVLLDVQMPEMDGFETATLMRRSRRTRNVPIIFVTANFTHRDHIFQGYAVGAVDYLPKPVDPAILQSKVRVFEELYRQRKLLEDANTRLDAQVAELQRLRFELEEKNRILQTLSLLDGLTGIPNRRHFDDTLRTEWGRLLREGTSLALIMIDIDHFKCFNDHYGHLHGDRCLKRIAGCLSASLKRPSDFVARYGGEEFAVILPSTDHTGACHVAETLRQAVELLGIEHITSPTANHVTLSLGVSAVVPSPGCHPTDLVHAADQALYAAKHAGRNCWRYQDCTPDACIAPLT